jgi:hypothetical protein
MKQLGDSGLEALVRVGDDQLDVAEAALPELAQEGRPESFGLRRAVSIPSTSRRPSLLTPTATITATETTRLFRRTFT